MNLPGTSGRDALAGTEIGLGIPKPPLYLSGKYEPAKDRVTLYWENPREPYDELRVCMNKVMGSTTSYSYDCGGHFEPDKPFFINGLRRGTPSNYSAINVLDRSQEELGCPPFYYGVMPNWSSWSTKTGGASFEQATKDGVNMAALLRLPQKISGPDDKPFFQLIKSGEPTIQAGICRKFLGLTPGHTYRLYSRLNTLGMDDAKDDWSYSLHVAYNASGGANFTTDQLSGRAPLPDGSTGAAAGQIVEYKRGATTKGKWIQSSTGDTTSGIKDVIVPQGTDTITVWVRLAGAAPTGVGIDWVKLEDVTK